MFWQNKNKPRKITEALFYWKAAAIFLLFIFIVAVAWFYFKSKNDSCDYEFIRNKYPYIDVSRNIIPQEDYIINIQPLREKLNAITEEFGIDSISLYVEFLITGANISVNPNLYIYPASLAKVPLAMAVMKKIEKGNWKLENELVLMKDDKDNRSGSYENPLSEYPVGTRFTIERLLEELLINSDNTAFFVLLRNIHQDELNEIISELGLQELFSDNGKISAKEYSRIFRSLYVSSFLKRENSDMILRWLDNSTVDDFLSHDIPKEIPFPHKYGEKITLRIYSDSGIVYIPNRPYLITVMTKGDPSKSLNQDIDRTKRFMRQISKEAYDYFSSYR